MNVSLIGLIAVRAGLRLSALGLITAVLLMPPSQPTFARSPLVLVDFQGDTPGEPPATGDVGEPTYLVNPPGTSILVQSAANGIATQPAVLAAQDSSLYAAIVTHFAPVSEGVVRVEATVSVDRLAAGHFLETAVGSGPSPTAVVTRLYLTEVGKISVCAPGAVVGTYSANQPLRVRVDIDMSAHQWFVSVDNELDGFADDSRSWGLPFCNPVDVLPTVGAIWAGNALYPAATALAYDDIEAALLAGTEAGPADHLAVSLQPANATVGTSIGTVDIAVRNQDDALVETDQRTLVTLSLIGSPGSLSCTGGVVRQVADGIATFEGCTVTAPGSGYQLQASASGLTSATSSTFEMTAPGPGTGLLRVTTNPAVPSQVQVNGIPMDDWAINWAKMPPGIYTVSFSDLLGWSTPAPQTVNVVADEVTTVQGDFVLKGNLRVITSPAVPSTITIDGIPRDEWGLWTDFPVGSYQAQEAPPRT